MAELDKFDVPVDEICITRIVKQYPDLDNETIVDIMGKLNDIDEAHANDPFKLIQKRVELLNDIELTYKKTIRTIKKDSLIREKNIKHVTDDQFSEYPHEALIGLVEGSNRVFKGSRDSVEALADSNTSMFEGNFFDTLIENNLFEDLTEGNLDAEIVDELLKDISSPDYIPNQNSKIVKAAELIKQLGDGLYNRLSEAIDMPYLPDWIIRTNWDGGRMLGNKKEFMKSAFRYFDLDRMFPEIKDTKRRGIVLSEIYDSIVSRTTDYHTENTLSRAKSLLGNLQSNRVIHFKDGSSYSAMMKEFGYGNLLEGILQTIDMYSRRHAAFEVFGSTPIAEYDKLAKAISQKHRDKPKLKTKLESGRKSLQSAIYGPQRGVTTEARIVQYVKDFNDMTLLGKLGITGATGDLASTWANQMSQGKHFLEAGTKSVTEFFDQYGEDKVEIAKHYKLALDSERMELISSMREQRQDGIRNAKWKKVKTAIAKWSLGVWQFQASRKSRALAFGRETVKNIKTEFKDLSPLYKSNLEENGITEEMWNIIRQSKAHKTLGLTIENVANMPLSHFEKNSEGMSPLLYKNKILSKYNQMLINTLNDEVPVPGLKERRRLGGNLNPDSFWGLVTSLTSQFKGVPLKMMGTFARNLRRAGGKNNLKDALKTRNGMSLFAQAFIALTTMAYVNLVLRSIIAGEDPPDPTDQKTWGKVLAMSGTLGLWGDLMLGEYEQIYRNPVKDLAGPSFSRASDLLELIAKIRAGQDVSSTAAAQLFRALPGNNLWFVHNSIRKSMIESIKELSE